MLKIFLPLAVLVASTSSTAQQAAPAPPAPVVKINPLDKVICRTDDSSGGRLNRKKVCMSVREWQDLAQASREATEKLQQQGQNVPH